MPRLCLALILAAGLAACSDQPDPSAQTDAAVESERPGAPPATPAESDAGASEKPVEGPLDDAGQATQKVAEELADPRKAAAEARRQTFENARRRMEQYGGQLKKDGANFNNKLGDYPGGGKDG